MAYLKQLPAAALPGIARQIGARLFSTLSPASVPSASFEGEEPPPDFEPLAGITDFTAARFEVTESFEVWRLRAGALDEFVLTGEDLASLARPSGAWHHQIRISSDGTDSRDVPIAYARSWLLGTLSVEWSVRDLFLSPLAAAVDKAIRLADDQITEDVEARMLSLAEYSLEALWFVAPPVDAEAEPRRRNESRVIVISASDDFPKARLMSPMNSNTFLRLLLGMKAGMGFRI